MSTPPPSGADPYTASDVLAPNFWTGTPARPVPGLDVACTKIAVDFQNLTRDSADRYLQSGMELLRDAASADAAFVLMLDAAGCGIETVTTAGGGFAQCRPENLKGETLARLPWLASRTDHLRLSEFRDTADPRPEQAQDASMLALLGAGSALFVSMHIRGRHAGYVGLAFGLPRGEFDVNLQLLMKLLGSSLATGLERVRLNLDLHKLEERHRAHRAAGQRRRVGFRRARRPRVFLAALAADAGLRARGRDADLRMEVADPPRRHGACADRHPRACGRQDAVLREHPSHASSRRPVALGALPRAGGHRRVRPAAAADRRRGRHHRPAAVRGDAVPREGKRAHHAAVHRRRRRDHRCGVDHRLHQSGGRAAHRLAHGRRHRPPGRGRDPRVPRGDLRAGGESAQLLGAPRPPEQVGAPVAADRAATATSCTSRAPPRRSRTTPARSSAACWCSTTSARRAS